MTKLQCCLCDEYKESHRIRILNHNHVEQFEKREKVYFCIECLKEISFIDERGVIE